MDPSYGAIALPTDIRAPLLLSVRSPDRTGLLGLSCGVLIWGDSTAVTKVTVTRWAQLLDGRLR